MHLSGALRAWVSQSGLKLLWSSVCVTRNTSVPAAEEAAQPCCMPGWSTLKLESLEGTDGEHEAKWLRSPVQLSKEGRQFAFSQWWICQMQQCQVCCLSFSTTLTHKICLDVKMCWGKSQQYSWYSVSFGYSLLKEAEYEFTSRLPRHPTASEFLVC